MESLKKRPQVELANSSVHSIMSGAYATLAQSAEQTLRKRQVLGSIPKGGFLGPGHSGAFLSSCIEL